MTHKTCRDCGRPIVIVKHPDGHMFALEKKAVLYEIQLSPIAEWEAVRVDPFEGKTKVDIYEPHAMTCAKKEVAG